MGFTGLSKRGEEAEKCKGKRMITRRCNNEQALTRKNQSVVDGWFVGGK